MSDSISQIELSLAKESFKDKPSEELEEFLELGPLFGDWPFGKALAEAAKQILLDRSDKILLKDDNELKSET